MPPPQVGGLLHYLLLIIRINEVILGVPKIRQATKHFPTVEIHAKTMDYVNPFENCTTMVFSKTNIDWRAYKKSTLGPIMLLDFKTNTNLGPVFRKLSLQRRRNPSKHCWATFAILPEKYGFSLHYLDFLRHPCFIQADWPLQYFIWVTTIRKHVQNFLTHFYVLEDLGLREVILVDVNNFMGEGSLLSMEYHNIYAIPDGIVHSEAWYSISCLPNDCLKYLAIKSKALSKLSKYFWTMANIQEISAHAGLSHHRYRKIAKLTKWNDFVAFLILQDVLTESVRNVSALHFIPHIQRVENMIHERPTLILYGSKSYSFVSCYNVKTNFSVISALTDPFDGASWIFLASNFAAVVTILKALSNTQATSDGVLHVIGVSLENSGISFRTIYGAKVHYLIGIYAITAVWMLLVGTILTNWYKTWFTMDMIIPKIYQTPWASVMDVEGVKVLMPLFLLDEYDYDLLPRNDYILHKAFYFQLLQQCFSI